MILRGKLICAQKKSEKYIEGYTSIEGFLYHKNEKEQEYAYIVVKRENLVGIVVDYWPEDGKYIELNKVLLNEKSYWFRTEDLEEIESLESFKEKNERNKSKQKIKKSK